MSAPEQDLAALGRMLERLRQVVHKFGGAPKDLGPISLSFRDGTGRGHRVVLLRPDALALASDLTLVGFFGQRKKGVSSAPLYSFDSDLIDELGGHPDIVSYSSLDLSDDESGNLVLAANREALDRWQRSAKHGVVSKELAPRHYASVRIHTGILPGGVPSSHEPRIATTRALSFAA